MYTFCFWKGKIVISCPLQSIFRDLCDDYFNTMAMGPYMEQKHGGLLETVSHLAL